MAYIRKKIVGGNEYLYKVSSYRDKKTGKVQQRVEQYLGATRAKYQTSRNSESGKYSTKKRNTKAANSSRTDEWYTPEIYIDMVREVLGEIDLDPATSSLPQTWIKARQFYTKEDDGLAHEWHGKVWMNPPSNTGVSPWINKIISEHRQKKVKEAIILVKSSIGTKWYHEICSYCLRCETFSRIKFLDVNGVTQTNPYQGNTFFYLGENPKQFYLVFKDIGSISAPLDKIFKSKNNHVGGG